MSADIDNLKSSLCYVVMIDADYMRDLSNDGTDNEEVVVKVGEASQTDVASATMNAMNQRFRSLTTSGAVPAVQLPLTLADIASNATMLTVDIAHLRTDNVASTYARIGLLSHHVREGWQMAQKSDARVSGRSDRLRSAYAQL